MSEKNRGLKPTDIFRAVIPAAIALEGCMSLPPPHSTIPARILPPITATEPVISNDHKSSSSLDTDLSNAATPAAKPTIKSGTEYVIFPPTKDPVCTIESPFLDLVEKHSGKITISLQRGVKLYNFGEIVDNTPSKFEIQDNEESFDTTLVLGKTFFWKGSYFAQVDTGGWIKLGTLCDSSGKQIEQNAEFSADIAGTKVRLIFTNSGEPWKETDISNVTILAYAGIHKNINMLGAPNNETTIEVHNSQEVIGGDSSVNGNGYISIDPFNTSKEQIDHEINHALYRYLVGNAKPWFIEGLAEWVAEEGGNPLVEGDLDKYNKPPIGNEDFYKGNQPVKYALAARVFKEWNAKHKGIWKLFMSWTAIHQSLTGQAPTMDEINNWLNRKNIYGIEQNEWAEYLKGHKIAK